MDDAEKRTSEEQSGGGFHLGYKNCDVQGKIERRFALSADDYIKQMHLEGFLQDVVKYILEKRSDRPLNLIHEYFEKIAEGTDVVGRNYAYISSAPRSRMSFIRQFGSAYANFVDSEEVTRKDYHQLLAIMCPSFPYFIVAEAMAIFDSEEVVFVAASRAVHIYFFYFRFIRLLLFCFTQLTSKSKDVQEIRSLEHLVSAKLLSKSSDSVSVERFLDVVSAAVYGKDVHQHIIRKEDEVIVRKVRALDLFGLCRIDLEILSAALREDDTTTGGEAHGEAVSLSWINILRKILTPDVLVAPGLLEKGAS